MRLRRPHIPVAVCVEVAARQLQEHGRLSVVLRASLNKMTNTERLAFMLNALFPNDLVHLDHDPPLCLREIIDAEKGIYDPPANDPDYLIYRTVEDHRRKTFIHGDGAQLSDAGKRRKEIRRKRKATPRPSRWPPKGSRPLRGRPF